MEFTLGGGTAEHISHTRGFVHPSGVRTGTDFFLIVRVYTI